MSVLKKFRKESKFKVLQNMCTVSKEMADLFVGNFGYDRAKAEKKLLRKMGANVDDIEGLTEKQRETYKKMQEKYDMYEDFLLYEEKCAILAYIRGVYAEVFLANSICPIYYEELIERRIHMDRAIGLCYALVQELFFIVTVLPVNHNIYTRMADLIGHEIELLKKWRQSDSRFNNMIRDRDRLQYVPYLHSQETAAMGQQRILPTPTYNNSLYIPAQSVNGENGMVSNQPDTMLFT